jgi:hypothetical protein
MKRNKLDLKRMWFAAILLSLPGLQVNCLQFGANSSSSGASRPSTPACHEDGIGCGIPELGAAHIGYSFNALPVQIADLMYNNAQRAGLKVDRIGTYWDWFMDQDGNYNSASPYLQELDAQIALDLAHSVTPEFLLGTEAPNYMPGLQGPNNLPDWNYYPSRTAAFQALANILTNLVARFPHVKYWELFNEMDAPGFTTLFVGAGPPSCPIQRGKLYGQMLDVVVPPARRVNPSIHILMGGMAGALDILGNPSFSFDCGISTDFDIGLPQTMADFLKGIYSVGAESNFDIVNAHAYADSSFNAGSPMDDIDIDPRFRSISAILHQTVLAQKDRSKQFWITEIGTSGSDAINSGVCSDTADLGPCMDRTQVNVLGSVVNDLMQNHLFDVAIIYALCPGSGGTPNASYNQYLPQGMTVNDYGFQVLRSDDITLRPMVRWLIQRNNCLSHGGNLFTANWGCQ